MLHTQGVRPLCCLPLGRGTWSSKRRAHRGSSQRVKETFFRQPDPDSSRKTAFQMHSEHEDMIRMEKAVKSVWLLRGICLYILIASSFSFISSGTWLPNERIDYLSQMHISQLQAIKACKISTASGPRSGF